MACVLGQQHVTPAASKSTGHARAGCPRRPLRAHATSLPYLRPARPPQAPPPPSYPLAGLPPSGPPRRPLRRVPVALPLLQVLPLLAAGRPRQVGLRRLGPPGRPRPHPRGRPQRPAHPRRPEARLLPEAVRGLRLRLLALEGRPARPEDAPADGPGEVLRHPVSRRTAPGPLHPAAGD